MKKQSLIGIVPLEDRVLLKEIKEETAQHKTKSGIFLPESADKDTGGIRRGTVVAIGAGRLDDGEVIPMNVKVGDTVLYTWGEKIKIDGEEYTILREAEIAAIIK
jgi:chaperonin GroES